MDIGHADHAFVIRGRAAIQIRLSAVCPLRAHDCKAVSSLQHCSQPGRYLLLWMTPMWDAARGHLRSSGSEMRIRKHANPILLAGEKRHNNRDITLLIGTVTGYKMLLLEDEG